MSIHYPNWYILLLQSIQSSLLILKKWVGFYKYKYPNTKTFSRSLNHNPIMDSILVFFEIPSKNYNVLNSSVKKIITFYPISIAKQLPFSQIFKEINSVSVDKSCNRAVKFHHIKVSESNLSRCFNLLSVGIKNRKFRSNPLVLKTLLDIKGILMSYLDNNFISLTENL